MLLDDNIGGEFLELANTCSEIRGTGSACGGGETGSSSSFIAVSKKKNHTFCKKNNKHNSIISYRLHLIAMMQYRYSR